MPRSFWRCDLVPKNCWVDSNFKLDVEVYNDIKLKNGIRKDLAMLVYDSFKGHLEEYESGFDLAVIPGNLTSICQPLDVTINKITSKEWHVWMSRWWCWINCCRKSSPRQTY